MSSFMSSLSTKYVRYFNTRHKRIGHLFQDRYKAVKIENENQWIHLSKYIHRNPLDLPAYGDLPAGRQAVSRRLEEYKYSSYPNYLGTFHQTWVDTEEILSNFGTHKNNSYRKFVEEPIDIAPIYFSAIDYD